MALTYSKQMQPGTEAPAFALPGIDGQTWTLADFSDAKVLVVVFTCNHCPYAKASEDRLVQLQRDYADRGVRLVAINPNVATHPDDGFEQMKRRAEQKGFNFPYLADEAQEVSRAYDAACTPDIYVLGPDRTLVCQTRLDDNWQDPSAVGRHDLREILDATLEGKPLPFESTPSMGCSIKWKG
ncbi:MAG: thioredoxin family protein [Polyangiales bacterium]